MSVGLACATALGFQSLDLGLSSGLVTALSFLAAVAVVLCFVRATRPQNI